jgi:hypothetical protein
MARGLGIPVRTWYNYEGGANVPIEITLKIIEVTSVEPAWLLRGEGPKFRRARSERLKPMPTREEGPGTSRGSEASRATGGARQRTRRAVIAEILSRASSLKAPEDLEELTAGVLALRARTLAPVASGEETRLLLAVNEGISAELRDRLAALLQKRDDYGVTAAENRELMQLADEVERRGVERVEALSRLAELRGVSLAELMKSLGIAAGNHG